MWSRQVAGEAGSWERLEEQMTAGTCLCNFFLSNICEIKTCW